MQIMVLRESVVRCLAQLRRGIAAHFRSRDPINLIGGHVDPNLWDETAKALARSPMIPQDAVDPWGLVGQGRSRSAVAAIGSEEAGFASRVRTSGVAVTVARYQDYLHREREVLGGLESFFRQAVPVMRLHTFEGHTLGGDVVEILKATRVSEGLDVDGGHMSAHNLVLADRGLEEFQRAFRMSLGELVPREHLAHIEARETEALTRTWPLYLQFVAHPEARAQDAEKRALLKAKDIRNAFLRSLANSLNQLRRSGISAQTCGETISDNGTPTLWITVEAEDLDNLVPAVTKVADALRPLYANLEYRTFEQTVLSGFADMVALIPVVRGVSPAGVAFNVHTYRFYGGKDQGNANPTLLPVQLSDPVIPELKLKIRDLDRHSALFQLQGSLMEIAVRIGSLENLAESSNTLDSTGHEILQDFVDGIGAALASARTRALKACRELQGDQERPYPLTDADREALNELESVLANAAHGTREEEIPFGSIGPLVEAMLTVLPRLERLSLVSMRTAVSS